MPRRRPSALRRPRPHLTPIDGVPLATCRALDRLGRREISSAEVARHLVTWRQVAGMPARRLEGPYNDWLDFIGPNARDHLEIALRALTTRQARDLRAVVARIDGRFAAKTLPDPGASPHNPWWSRRG